MTSIRQQGNGGRNSQAARPARLASSGSLPAGYGVLDDHSRSVRSTSFGRRTHRRAMDLNPGSASSRRLQLPIISASPAVIRQIDLPSLRVARLSGNHDARAALASLEWRRSPIRSALRQRVGGKVLPWWAQARGQEQLPILVLLYECHIGRVVRHFWVPGIPGPRRTPSSRAIAAGVRPCLLCLDHCAAVARTLSGILRLGSSRPASPSAVSMPPETPECVRSAHTRSNAPQIGELG